MDHFTHRFSYRIVENGTHWHSYHTDVGCGVCPVRCRCEGMVQNLEHVMIIPDLLMAGWILVVRFLDWDLVEPGARSVTSGVIPWVVGPSHIALKYI